jgi:hypothetical protein
MIFSPPVAFVAGVTNGAVGLAIGGVVAPAVAGGAVVDVEPVHALAASATTEARAANRMKPLLTIRSPFLSPW